MPDTAFQTKRAHSVPAPVVQTGSVRPCEMSEHRETERILRVSSFIAGPGAASPGEERSDVLRQEFLQESKAHRTPDVLEHTEGSRLAGDRLN